MEKGIINYLFFLLVLALNGCYGAAPMFMSFAPEAIRTAADIEKGVYKDVELSLGKGFERKDLKKFKKVAFLIGPTNRDYYDGISLVFNDNLVKEFMKLGIEVMEREILEEAINELKFQRGMFASTKNLVKVGNMVGVNGIFRGSVQSGQDYSIGLMGLGGGLQSGIISASLKLVDVETAKVVLIITTNFKKPKGTDEVAEDIAQAFKLYRDVEAKPNQNQKQEFSKQYKGILHYFKKN